MSIHATYEYTTLNRNTVSMIIPRGAMIVFMSKIKYKDRIVYVTI